MYCPDFFKSHLTEISGKKKILICKIFDVYFFLNILEIHLYDDKENNAIYSVRQYGTSSCPWHFSESQECQSELLKALKVTLPQS